MNPIASIDNIKNIGEITAALVSTWAVIRLIIGSKKYFKRFYMWLLAKLLKTYVESVAQEKINERLANIVEQLIDEDINKLEEIADKSINATSTSWHALDDFSFIKLKSLGLINESFDYNNSNKRLKDVLQNWSFTLKYKVLHQNRLQMANSSIEINHNILIFENNAGEFFVSYNTSSGTQEISFDFFCQKIGFDQSDFQFSYTDLERLENHINYNVIFRNIFPMAVESTTIDTILWVSVKPTMDGWILVNLIKNIKENSYNENMKYLNTTDKATRALIRKFSKLK